MDNTHSSQRLAKKFNALNMDQYLPIKGTLHA